MLIDDNLWPRGAVSRRRPPFWIGRPVELPGSRPLDFEFRQDLGAQLIEWPVAHYDQVPVLLPPGRSGRAEGGRSGKLLRRSTRRAVGREFLIEIISRQGRDR